MEINYQTRQQQRSQEKFNAREVWNPTTMPLDGVSEFSLKTSEDKFKKKSIKTI